MDPKDDDDMPFMAFHKPPTQVAVAVAAVVVVVVVVVCLLSIALSVVYDLYLLLRYLAVMQGDNEWMSWTCSAANTVS
jgi:hypothetical protein